MGQNAGLDDFSLLVLLAHLEYFSTNSAHKRLKLTPAQLSIRQVGLVVQLRLDRSTPAVCCVSQNVLMNYRANVKQMRACTFNYTHTRTRVRSKCLVSCPSLNIVRIHLSNKSLRITQ